MQLLNSIQSEYIKTKRSTAFWLGVVGGLFLPTIHFIVFLVKGQTIEKFGPKMWEVFIKQNWENMSMFLLPMGVILATSLITQMEFKNNTWKQVHASPQSFLTVFSAKFVVVLVFIAQFFLFFSIALILSVYGSSLIVAGKLPSESLPLGYFLKLDLKYFIACLPIIAFQYLISLLFKNFLVPIGIGFLGLVGSLIGLSWEYIFVSPYAYTAMITIPIPRDFNVLIVAAAYFFLLLALAYFLYSSKKEKG